MSRKPINPKRIKQVRELRMLDAAKWPDDIKGEVFGHFCMITGFPVAYFRQDDPPELGEFICRRGRSGDTK